MRDPDALAKLGAALRAERERQGKSLADLSAASGLHRSHIARIERGECEPRLSTLMKLRQGLGSLATVFERLEAEAGERNAPE
jgi:transcriptional regulator with XRE-family HTH domain